MKVNPNYLKIVADLLIPILGFFWWGWNLYFILLFLLLDFGVSEVLVHLKTKKIKSYSEKVDQTKWLRFGAASFGLVLLSIGGIHLGMKNIHPTIEFGDEIYNFLAYKEMGVAQGVVLIPLIVLMGYSQYKSEFLMPRLFQSINFEKLWKMHFLNQYAILILISVLCVLTAFTSFHEWVYLVIVLLSIVGFKIWLLISSMR